MTEKKRYMVHGTEKPFLVIANYQPAAMFSRPEDHQESRHDSLEEVVTKMEYHEKHGASDIELFEFRVRWEPK